MTPYDRLRAIRWEQDALQLLDQRRLPSEQTWLRCEDVPAVTGAIREMVVRGAPAIGCAAAYGLVLAAREAPDAPEAFAQQLAADAATLTAARPTAVNLAWAVDRVHQVLKSRLSDGVEAARAAALREAHAIAEADVEACKRLARHGLELLPSRVRLLTHCNAGAIATGGYGTALGVVRAAAEAGRLEQVYADETRPRQQGARLTAWELQYEGLPVTVIADTAAGSLMARGAVNCVVVGADRIAANGDVANKIGTYPLAILAAYHEIPFFVAAPLSTVDFDCPDGEQIPVEQRDPDEVALIEGVRVVPAGVPCENPAFDVTPASLVQAIFTERGVAKQPFEPSLAALRPH
jgi:methylthioribose-1-phosphate isomerase